MAVVLSYMYNRFNSQSFCLCFKLSCLSKVMSAGSSNLASWYGAAQDLVWYYWNLHGELTLAYSGQRI